MKERLRWAKIKDGQWTIVRCMENGEFLHGERKVSASPDEIFWGDFLD